eukprot:scaffold22759_cov111-Isochrysis_galbana.AAC.3
MPACRPVPDSCPTLVCSAAFCVLCMFYDVMEGPPAPLACRVTLPLHPCTQPPMYDVRPTARRAWRSALDKRSNVQHSTGCECGHEIPQDHFARRPLGPVGLGRVGGRWSRGGHEIPQVFYYTCGFAVAYLLAATATGH